MSQLHSELYVTLKFGLCVSLFFLSAVTRPPTSKRALLHMIELAVKEHVGVGLKYNKYVMLGIRAGMIEG